MALALMAYNGLSANLMSLRGLAVAIGMMVDGAVVMMENIFKHLSHPDQRHDAEVAARVSADDQDPTTLPTIATSACASRKRRGSGQAGVLLHHHHGGVRPLFSLEGVEISCSSPWR